MVETREPTSGELTKIYDIAHNLLPPVIDIYAGCSGTLSGITQPTLDARGRQMEKSDEQAFERPVSPPTGTPSGTEATGTGPIFPAYTAARNEFHNLMALVATNLTTASNGFNSAYNAFKDTDHDNAREVDGIEVPEEFESGIPEQPAYPEPEG